MRQIGEVEAKSRLGELLAAVEDGEAIIITRHGRPVAKLVPFTAHDQAGVAGGIAELRRLQRTIRLGDGESVTDLIDEGRRD